MRLLERLTLYAPLLAIWIFGLLIMPELSGAQAVVNLENESATLAQKVEQGTRYAMQNVSRNDSEEVWQTYWLGYSIVRRMSRNSRFGGSGYDSRRQGTLKGWVEGEERVVGTRRVRTAGVNAAGNTDADGSISYANPDEEIEKDIAILLKFTMDGGGAVLKDIDIAMLDGWVDLDELPVIWMGSSPDGESIELLWSLFESSSEADVKEDLVSVIGYHDRHDLTLPLLKRILFGNYPDDLREQATVGIGWQDSDAALSQLLQTARTDLSEDVRESARFWLAQKVVQKMLGDLNAVNLDPAKHTSSEQTDLQKQAVFALTQLDTDSVPLLIELGNSHNNPEIRQQAIFWLGQGDDPRALDALVSWLGPGFTF